MADCYLRAATLGFATLLLASGGCDQEGRDALGGLQPHAGAGDAPCDPPWTGQPLPEAEPGEWTWVDVEGTECIDGSPSGVGIRYGEESDKVAIVFEAGGACFNEVTCGSFMDGVEYFDESNPAEFSDFAEERLAFGMNTDDPENPFHDWNLVFVPYCTGDVHAGSRENGEVPDFQGDLQFRGYHNFGLDLERIGATFPWPSQVVVTGASAGGFGAAFNYDRVASAYEYADIPVSLLDDSGPPFDTKFASACLQEQWRDLWGLDRTLPPDCDDCYGNDGWALNLARYIRDKHPHQKFGMVSYTRDLIIRLFFGTGLRDCKGGIYGGRRFTRALNDLRDEFGEDPNFSSYYIRGADHTILSRPTFDTTVVKGVSLKQWLTDFLDPEGNSANVGP